jgi:BNR repeat-like domain
LTAAVRTAIAAAAALAAAAAGAIDLATPDVVVARRNSTPTPGGGPAADYDTYFPTVTRLQNDDLVTVYYESPGHVDPLGRVAMVRSRDSGRTWTPPAVIVDRVGVNHRDPSVMQTRRGTLLVNYFLYFDGRSLGVFVIRSTDSGAHWSEPIAVGTSLAGPATSAKIAELDNGDLLIPIAGGRAGDGRIRAAVVRSRDDGRTWPRASEALIADDPSIDFVEPALVAMARGEIVAAVGSERGAENHSFETRSRDYGRTWSRPAKAPMAGNASDLLRVEIPGRRTPAIVHAWGDRSRQFGDGRPTVMALQASPVEMPMGPVKVLYHGHCLWGDESYPSTVQLKDGRLFTVFYDACAGYIGGRYTAIEELLAAKK